MTQQRCETPQSQWLAEPIAIVGMACRLPGGDGLDEYWSTIRDGRSAIAGMPADRLDQGRYFDAARGKRGKTYSAIGGCVSPRDLDWSLLNIARDDADAWDACHLNFYEVAARACTDASYDPRNMPSGKTGVFVGHSGGTTLGGELAYRTLAPEHRELLAKCLGSENLADQLIAELIASRPARRGGRPMVDAGYAAGLVSHAMGLDGPHMSIDAACASSLVALQLGVLALRSGQADRAIVGGASFNKSDSLVLFSHAQSCSASGSRPFDDSADGLVGSEGYVALVIKTLEQARADGDRVHAIVRGIGLASDGRGKSLWAPRKEGQYEAIRRAYVGGVSPASVQMIEAHATSTKVGDATELTALSDFYREHLPAGSSLPVGSVKSNLGHTLETAGLAGVVKAVLSMQHGVIPPTINVEELNTSVSWEQSPLRVNRSSQDWPRPTDGQPRRAAVNAFGIGGLNVHVVVEENAPQAKPTNPKPTNSQALIPTAIVGRGVVLPGANNLAELRKLLDTGGSQLSRESGNRKSVKAAGYVRSFEYDWRKHRIPPKQIAQANPLQFMLLDAAEQAMQEAGLHTDNYDKKRVAVVVGSPFGGDFGNELYAGLRLPEVRERADKLLAEQGLASKQRELMLDQYEREFLKRYPALLDETGSFTSSTLASRLSKTFDLMGGALAIDSGDTSGAAALDIGRQLLASGSVDYVLCAVAHRALDAAAIENLEQLDRLPVTKDGSVQIGEGAALVVLTQLAAAEKAGQPVHTIVHSCEATMHPTTENKVDFYASPLFPVTGYLQASQSLVDVICATLKAPNDPVHLTTSTASGLTYSLDIGPRKVAEKSGEQPRAITGEPLPTQRFTASSREELVEQLKDLASGDRPHVGPPQASCKTENTCCAAIAADNIEAQRSGARRLAAKLNSPTVNRQGFDRGAIWKTGSHVQPTVLWLFPGQGSQSTGMFRDLCENSAAARAALRDADHELTALGEPTFAQIAWSEPNQLGSNIWQTQAAMLVADWIASQTLRSMGVRCDYVCGHSFGEIPAMLVAGCWDLATALRATKLRCEALEHVPSQLRLISIFGTDDQVAGYLRDFGARSLQISHRNSPQQFVAGGIHDEVTAFSKWLDSRGIINRQLTVPTAFHTEHLRPAVEVFRRSLEQIPIVPPKIPLLSTVHGSFVSDPIALRQNLANQLVTQLDFVEAITRLKSVDITHAIEVGPQQVLTKLVSPFAKNWVFLPFDAPTENRGHRAAFEVAVDLFDLEETKMMARQSEKTTTDHQVAKTDILRYDATAKRREKMREGSRTSPKLPELTRLISPIQFDATEKRRIDNRGPLAGAVKPSTSVSQPPITAPHPQAATSDSIAQFLIDLIVEQTGYPAEIIELDWAFEADLGIDSIKKAQIFGELREFIDVDSDSSLRLDDFATLRDVVALLESSPGKRDWLEEPAESTTPSAHEHTNGAVTLAPPPTDASSPTSELADVLIDFVVEQTGFPREMVALDADLESDLGIDSIKKAQLLGEVRELLGNTSTIDVQNATQSMGSLDSLRSLQDILAILQDTASESSNTHCAPTDTNRLTALRAALPAEQTSAASISTPQATTPTSDRAAADLAGFLIDFVIDQTGYPREIVELDADLEADLGIDSIKKAQLLGEVQETLAIDLTNTASETKLSLDGLRTLRDILALAAPSATQPQNEQAAAAALPTPTQKANRQTHPASVDNDLRVPVRKFTPHNDVDYLQAVKRNLHCFVARSKADTGDSSAPRPTSQTVSVKELAGAANVPSEALASLSRHLVDTVFWLPSRQPQTGNTAWVSTLHVPAWLSQRGETLAIEVDPQTGFVLISTPGCELPLACIPSPERAVILEGTTARPTRAQLTNLAAGQCDSDTTSGTVVRVEGGSYDRSQATSEAVMPGPNHVPAARIGYDRETRRIAIQQLTCPYAGPTDIAIPALEQRPPTSAPAPKLPPLPKTDVSHDIASRFVLRMVPSQLPEVPGRHPSWAGGAVVVGDNPIARQLEARLKSVGVPTIRLISTGDEFGLRDAFRQFASTHTAPHLFLASAWDTSAETAMDAAWWSRRKNDGLLANFWLAQAWLEHIVASDIIDDASLIAVSCMGGDFGISGRGFSVEGGGLGGLLKSILIETWMQGHRGLPIKTIDTQHDQSPAAVVDCIWQELAIPSYDNEVSYAGGTRQVVRAIRRPLEASSLSATSLPQGGTWVCTGGARGITAFVAERLASRFGLTLHLLGTTGLDGFDTAWRDLDPDGLSQLKKQTLMQARDRGVSPVKAWQDTEKVLEIDATLRRLRASGIEVHYHVCDCSDSTQVQETLATVRSISGGITGVLHGAGIGKDARFERKQPDKVRQCIAAKIDGSLALMEATRDDPLEYFVGFGSISGRFGANGHTDYSLANEMLCKQVAWFSRQRPEVKAVGFHWHAWGDVGMATKPETRLALEMIDMQFMPAEEGVEHLVRELASGATEGEIVITDDRYYRMFYPAESVLSGEAATGAALLNGTTNPGVYSCKLDPQRDPFLTEHVLDKRPLLPMVVGIELLAEAAEKFTGNPCQQMHEIEALSALRFFSDQPQEIFAKARESGNGHLRCTVESQFVGRSGHVSDQQRVNFQGTVRSGDPVMEVTRLSLPETVSWSRVSYPDVDAKFYVGWPLQKLRRVACTAEGLVGQISAPALIELAGGNRDTSSWRVPSAAMDACLFAVGIFTWQQIRSGISLPVGIGRLTLGRLPRPGEACEVHVRAKGHTDEQATFDFSLLGIDGSLILNAEDYRTAWIAGALDSAASTQQAASPLRGN